MADMHQKPEHPSGSTAEERSRSIEERIAATAPQGGWDEMVEAIRGGRLEKIDPDRRREVVMERFSVEGMVDGYEKALEKILALQSTSRAGQGKPATRAAS